VLMVPASEAQADSLHACAADVQLEPSCADRMETSEQHDMRAVQVGPQPPSPPLDELDELDEPELPPELPPLEPDELELHADAHVVQLRRHVRHDPVQLVICDWQLLSTQDSQLAPRAPAMEAEQLPPLEPELEPEPLPPLDELLPELPLAPLSSPVWKPPVLLLDEHAAAVAAAPTTQPSTVTTSRTFITASLEGAQYGGRQLRWQRVFGD
jgi:hypothetical protein